MPTKAWACHPRARHAPSLFLFAALRSVLCALRSPPRYPHRVPDHVRLVFGCMTGTSVDALDAAAVRVEGRALDLRARVVAFRTAPLTDLAAPVRALCRAEPTTAGAIAQLALDLGERHARIIEQLAQDAGPPDLVALHGQTVFHNPPRSWQLLNPWPVARVANCPVVYDFRGADLCAHGQGAPITPIADWVLFRDERESRAVVNLGGFINVTRLPRAGALADVRAADVCACNQILDAVARRVLRAPYDDGGAHALRAPPHADALDDLSAALDAQRAGARSLGTGDECAQWLERWADRAAPDALCATAVAAIAHTLARALAEIGAKGRVLLAGGGTRNVALVRAIQQSAPAPVETTDRSAVPPDQREAAAMAVLGALAADGVPLTLPHVTRAREPIPHFGAWINAPNNPRP